jgi:hypothetical protein
VLLELTRAEGLLIQLNRFSISLLTRSVSTNLARPFKAGKTKEKCLRRVATLETAYTRSSLRDEGREEPDSRP